MSEAYCLTISTEVCKYITG